MSKSWYQYHQQQQHYHHTLLPILWKKSAFIRLFIRMLTHSDDFHTMAKRKQLFKSKFLHVMCLHWVWVFALPFLLSHGFNFTYQISIGKEQYRRWWHAKARIQTHVVVVAGRKMNDRPKEWKSMQLSHQHVTIFISLLGIFSSSSHHRSVKILVCLSWSLYCRS